MLVIAKSLLLQVQLEPFDLHLGYCNFYFPHIGLVGGLVQRQLNELRRVQQVSYLLLFCQRSTFNSRTVYLLLQKAKNTPAESRRGYHAGLCGPAVGSVIPAEQPTHH